MGFLGRGGLVLLILLPMLALPSPVSLSVLIGPDLVDANGLSARVAALLVLAGFTGRASWSDRPRAGGAGRHRRVRGPAQRGRRGRPSRGRGAGTALLVVELLALQLLAAVPVLVAALPAVVSVADLTRQEILLPSDQSLPLVVRVAEGAWPALAPWRP